MPFNLAWEPRVTCEDDIRDEKCTIEILLYSNIHYSDYYVVLWITFVEIIEEINILMTDGPEINLYSQRKIRN